jgi:hypothetical protein
MNHSTQNNRTMKLQDFFFFNESIVGLDGIFLQTPDGFFVNSSCIQSYNGVIKPNQLFLFQNFAEGVSDDIQLLRLLDVFFHQGNVNLYVMDMVSKETKIISHCISNGYLNIDWKITEINFLLELLKNGYEFTIPRTKAETDADID